MKLRPPSRADIERAAAREGCDLTAADLDGALLLLPGLLAGIEVLVEGSDPPAPAGRTVRERPCAEPDPLNAVVRRCRRR